jgi:hypothetical protein
MVLPFKVYNYHPNKFTYKVQILTYIKIYLNKILTKKENINNQIKYNNNYKLFSRTINLLFKLIHNKINKHSKNLIIIKQTLFKIREVVQLDQLLHNQ